MTGVSCSVGLIHLTQACSLFVFVEPSPISRARPSPDSTQYHLAYTLTSSLLSSVAKVFLDNHTSIDHRIKHVRSISNIPVSTTELEVHVLNPSIHDVFHIASSTHPNLALGSAFGEFEQDEVGDLLAVPRGREREDDWEVDKFQSLRDQVVVVTDLLHHALAYVVTGEGA